MAGWSPGLGRPGGDLLFRGLCRSTIGAWCGEPEPAFFQRDPQFPDPGSVCCGKAIVLTGAAALAPGLGRESLARGQLCIRFRAVQPIRCVYVALDSAWPMAATMVICAITLAPAWLPRGHL